MEQQESHSSDRCRMSRVDVRRLTPVIILLATGSATAWRTYRRRAETTSRRAALSQTRCVAHAYLDGIKRTLGGSDISFRIRRDEHGHVVLDQREVLQGATFNRSFTCTYGKAGVDVGAISKAVV